MTTNNPHYGATRNPWNLEHIPGGSSGGSGAAIAAGLATATMGTDTGGSIRMPASVCGVVGLKPTYGRVSKAGVLPLSYLFDHAGPITRTVEDAALRAERNRRIRPARRDHRAHARSTTTPRGCAPATCADCASAFRAPTSSIISTDEVAAAVEAAIATLRRLGADVRDVDVPGVANGVGALFALVLAEAQEIHARRAAHATRGLRRRRARTVVQSAARRAPR